MLRRCVGDVLANPWGFALMFALLASSGCGESEKPAITAETSKFQAAKDDGTAVEMPAKAVREVAQSEPDAPPPPAKPSRADFASPPAGSNSEEAPVATSPRKPVAAPAGDATEPAAPQAKLPKKIDPENLPDGTAEELLEMIAELDGRQPRGATREEMIIDFRNTLTARVRLAEKVLAMPNAKDEVRLEAARHKVSALAQASQVRLPGAENDLMAFCKEIAKDKAKSVARFGHHTLFQLELGSVAGGKEEAAKQVMETLKQILTEDGPQDDFFRPAQQAVMALQQGEFVAEAAEACRLISTTYQTSKNPDVVRVAKQILEVAETLEADIPGKLVALQNGQPKSADVLHDAVGKLLSSKNPGAGILEASSESAQMLEFFGHYPQAAAVYAAIGKAFQEHANEELAGKAKGDAARGERRLGLVGKPFEVDGKLLDGKPFDWKKYKGKVVLIDFWATWCGPCLKEIPNIKRSYEQFHEQGFEVVGINLDEDLSQVEEFFKVQTLPWTTIVSADPNAMGFENPMATKCGVASIPFVLLIGRDGKVTDIHVRGPRLEEKLAAMFEPAADDKKPAKPAGDKSSSLQRAARRGTGFVGAEETPMEKKPTASAAEKKADAAKPTTDANSAKSDVKLPELEGNPYSPREDLSPMELVDFIFNMQDKPKSIQARPGFAEAIVEAADRLLAAKTTEKFQTIAVTSKCETLHKQAAGGNEAADKQLLEFVAKLKDDARPKVAAEVKFLLLERQVIDAEKGPVEKIPDVLGELKTFCEQQKLNARHLRLASAAVQAVNRLEDGDVREKYFAELGGLFAKSESKELARYGKKLTKKPGLKESDLVGKPLELKGSTVDGAAFDWASYRGKVVLVDFWATWCGPCVREIPHVKELHAKYKAKGFEVVGISLDADLEALTTFLEQNALPWTTVAGEETQELATKYGVRGIPTMMLVDRDGKVLGVSHRSADFETQIAKLLSDVKN